MPVSIEREDDDDDEADDAIIARDYVMARAAAAIAALDSAKAQVTDMVALFITPEEDKKGRERKKLLDEAIETAGVATRSLEAAMDAFHEVDLEAGEPWEEDDEEGTS